MTHPDIQASQIQPPVPDRGALGDDPRFLELLEHLPDAVLLVRGETACYANAAARSQLGLSNDATLGGLTLECVLDGASANRLREAMQRACGGTAWTPLDRLRLRRPGDDWLCRDGELVALPGEGELCQLTLHEVPTDHDQLQVAAARRELAEASLRAIEAQERERARLSRELHDQIGQSLSALALRLRLLLQRHAIPEDDPQVCALSEILDDVLEQTRSLSLQLRPPQLDDFGLPSALRSLLQRLFANTGVHYDLEIEGNREIPANRVSVAAYRIVQESLTNVLRHAQARTLRVEIRADATGLALNVVDDGQGFDPGAVDPERLGLLGMHERADALGGTLRLHSRAGLGTLVCAWMPWTPRPMASA